MKKNTIIKASLTAGVAVGAWLAFRPSCSEDESAEVNPQKQDISLKPISLLMESQINVEVLTGEIIRKCFLDTVTDETVGKEMVVVLLKNELLESFGYYVDVDVDRGHYVLCKILNQIEHNDERGELLINFGKITQDLQGFLEKGNGMIRVMGDS